MINWIKAALSICVGCMANIFGGFDMLLKTLLFCMLFDYISGIICAIYQKKLNSKTGFKGILKKMGILSVVSLAAATSKIADAEGIRNIVIAFYIANEGISILENVAKMDIPITQRLKNILEQLKNQE
jgi:toxin secretion/phage lysis holin